MLHWLAFLLRTGERGAAAGMAVGTWCLKLHAPKPCGLASVLGVAVADSLAPSREEARAACWPCNVMSDQNCVAPSPATSEEKAFPRSVFFLCAPDAAAGLGGLLKAGEVGVGSWGLMPLEPEPLPELCAEDELVEGPVLCIGTGEEGVVGKSCLSNMLTNRPVSRIASGPTLLGPPK